ncbi:MAG: purine-nucleoside phosphorylase [Clostridiaceae bacterium]|jgi:purine-nucleoside phosphorylase|nr:purine-nucleoside phosphorylase [Clostridiaceae bacterium]
MSDYLNKLKQTADFLREKTKRTPFIALVLGSGLGNIANNMSNTLEISYEEIPNFPRTTVKGHDGKLIFGELGGKDILAMKGRFHFYEGWDMADVVFPIRVFKLLGINNLFLTNAAGGINTQFRPGDLMLIKDHIGFNADNPLRGENIDELGPRFPDMSHVYDRDLVEIAADCAIRLGLDIRRGIYSYTKGPSFETPSEIRALRALGADAVGMSTVPEAIIARHMDMTVLGISCITNMAAGVLDTALNHEEVIETGKKAEKRFTALVTEIIKSWD